MQVGNALGDPISVWLNPTGILIGVLAVLTRRLSRGGLHGRPTRCAPGSATSQDAFRARALRAAALLGVVAIGGLLVLRSDARPLYDGLTSGGGLVVVLASAVAGGVTLVLVWTPAVRAGAGERRGRGRLHHGRLGARPAPGPAPGPADARARRPRTTPC